MLDDLRRRWSASEASLFKFLDSVGATRDAHTYAVRLLPRTIESPQDFADWIAPRVQHDGMWSFFTTTSSGGERKGYAMPVAGKDMTRVPVFFFVEIHTQLIAWWLTTAWRTRQLATAASSQFAAAGNVIASAACARPLVETAAAFWVDGRKLAAIWDEIKRTGPLWSDQETGARYHRMMAVISEVSWGSKFDDRAPDWERRMSELIGRSNVLGAIDKLAKASDAHLQADYQWLCNTVHPSAGNTFAFSTPPLVHETRTHMITWYAGMAPHVVESDNTTHVETTVQSAIAQAATVSLSILHKTFDAALRFIDDLALTTGAPKVARTRYWRDLMAPEGRNEICSCRSALKSKLCRHEWGDPAPGMPSRFDESPRL